MTSPSTPPPEIDIMDRQIFPDTQSFYKAFIDYIPTPIKAPNGGYYLEYTATSAAAQRANKEVRKRTKSALTSLILEARIEEINKIVNLKVMHHEAYMYAVALYAEDRIAALKQSLEGKG
jgi:hypothetical protein